MPFEISEAKEATGLAVDPDPVQHDAAQSAGPRREPETRAHTRPRSDAGAPRPGDPRLRRRERLQLRRNYDRVFERKCSAADNLLVVYVSPNGLGWSRLGLSVGKRMGKAVERSAVRRRIREAFRTCKASIPPGLDVVCVAKPGVKEKTMEDVRASIVRLTHRAAGRLSANSRDKSPPACHRN